jgi:outer membrane murein-binding lipoprotein Lpp
MTRLTLVIPVALMALAGCASSPHGNNLARSADRLESNADALARHDHDDRGYASTSYSREADELAEKAHDFRRAVEDRDSNRGDLDAAFQSLSRTYHDLRDDVDHSDNREAQLDLKPVTDAYLDVEREMGGYHGEDRVARDRDHDRAYR